VALAYLLNLPTTKKKLKVMGDWTSDLLFRPDVAMIKRSHIDDLGYPQKTGMGELKRTEAQ
jgi:hypothetical protein